MVFVTYFLDLNKEQRQKVLQLDSDYFDSDIDTIKLLKKRHELNDAFIYYLKNNKLRGYCNYLINQEETRLSLNWFVCPKLGKEFLKLLLPYFFGKYENLEEIILNISIDNGESKKAAIARLNLYYSLNFVSYDLDKFLNNDSSYILLHMKLTRNNFFLIN